MIPFYLPNVGNAEIEAVAAVIRSGWLTTGACVNEFEQRFAYALDPEDPPHCIAVSSATAGLHLALHGHVIGPGDSVLVPTWTFPASAEAIELAGATPIFCDINPRTFNMTPEIAAPFAGQVQAVMPVHIAGDPCDVQAIADALTDHEDTNVQVIEDAAQAFGGEYLHGANVGAGPHTAVFSFYANKPITTGEGGMIATRDRDLAERCRRWRLHGLNSSTLERESTPLPFVKTTAGYKYNLSDVAAAMGVAQLKKAAGMLRARRILHDRYIRAFTDLPIQLPALDLLDKNACHLFIVALEDGRESQEFMGFMLNKGVTCRRHYVPLHRHPYFRDRYQLTPEQFPGAESIWRRVVSLPLYPTMTMDDQNKVVAAVRAFFP